MKKLYIAPQCVTEQIGKEDILTLSTLDAYAGDFFDYDSFMNGGTQA
ncbi:MAG: hypothetical protein J6B71_09515 [Clostridia bacterium]|nr:hypothetical protein [Clostridia bacterium]